MNKKKSLIILSAGIVTIAIAAVWTTEASAKPPRGKALRWLAQQDAGGSNLGSRGRHRVRFLQKLIGQKMLFKAEMAITDEQKQTIHAIFRDHRDSMVPLVKNVVNKHQDLRKAVLADESDENAIRQVSQELGKTIGDVAVQLSKLVPEVRAILTEEQQALLDEHLSGHEAAVNEFLDEILSE